MDLNEKAEFIRHEVIRVATANNQGHIAPSLSCVDILVALYYDVMGPDDHFILSKGHGCYGLYAILADKGVIPKEVWEKFQLPGCCERNLFYGIEASTGSLGHGLPMAVGLAWGLKMQNKPGHVWCIVGDGELQEGSCYEALSFHKELPFRQRNNLTVIIDHNHLQAMQPLVVKVLPNTDVAKRYDMHTLLKMLKFKHTRIRISTIKGHGLPCAENKAMWHYRVPTKQEYDEWLKTTADKSLMP